MIYNYLKELLILVDSRINFRKFYKLEKVDLLLFIKQKA